MTRRIKFAAALLSVVLLAVLATGIGVSAAIWTRPGSGPGGNTVGADTKAIDWNLYAKYFAYVNEGGELHLTKFYSADADPSGLNLSVMIIPNMIDTTGRDLPDEQVDIQVTEIRSSVFADTVLKELIVELYIPSSVKVIDPLTFMGMPNLKKVVFQDGSDCNVGAYAFANCPNLTEIVGKTNDMTWGEGNPTV